MVWQLTGPSWDYEPKYLEQYNRAATDDAGSEVRSRFQLNPRAINNAEAFDNYIEG